jgi:hypothetical protein
MQEPKRKSAFGMDTFIEVIICSEVCAYWRELWKRETEMAAKREESQARALIDLPSSHAQSCASGILRIKGDADYLKDVSFCSFI